MDVVTPPPQTTQTTMHSPAKTHAKTPAKTHPAHPAHPAHPESKQDVLKESLLKFYADADNLKTLTDVLRNETISLRILDWLVTNYAKKHNIVYLKPDARPFNMFLEYKSQLKAYSKKFFDPFCRRDRIDFQDADGAPLSTTVGQLNFFRWALVNGVVRYGSEHADDIEHDMMESIRHRYASRAEKPKRKELSKAAIKTCTKTLVKVTVRFA